MGTRKIYEAYAGDVLVCRGNAIQIEEICGVSSEQIWRYVKFNKIAHKIYRFVYIGREKKTIEKKPKEEYDYITWHLKHDKNTVVSEKDYAKNIDRLKEMFGEIKVTKIQNTDAWEKRRKKSYHYILEVGGA